MLLALAAGPARGNPSFSATKTATPPVLDGSLNDVCWQAAEPITGFKQRGSETPAEFSSVGYVCYDDANLYFGVRCMEPDPGSIVATARKHRILTHEEDVNVFADDSVEIMIKPSGDTSRYLQFAVSVSGATFDALRTHGGGGIDEGWDGEMTAATAIGQDHWTVEARIPFHTLEIGPEVISRWGVNICRNKKQPAELSAIAREGQFNETHKFAALHGLDVDFRRFCIQLDRPTLVGDIEGGRVSATATVSLNNNTGVDRHLKVGCRGDFIVGSNIPASQEVDLADGGQISLNLGPVSLGSQPLDNASTYEVVGGARVNQLIISDAGTGERLALSNLRYPARLRLMDIQLGPPTAEEIAEMHEGGRPMAVELTAAVRESTRKKGRLDLRVVHDASAAEVRLQTVPRPDRVSRVVVDRSELPFGKLQLRATFQDAEGQDIATARKPYENLPARDTSGKVLNNLVTELATLHGIEARPAGRRIRFRNPRNGWIHVSVTSPDENISVSLGDDNLLAFPSGRSDRSDTREAMRQLPAGPHTLTVSVPDGASLHRLAIRSIPYLIYWRYPTSNLSWDFLQAQVLGSMNTMGFAFEPAKEPESRPLFEEWEKQGKLLVVGTKSRIWEFDDPVKMAGDVAASPGYTDPLLDGAFQEEFCIGVWPIEKYLLFAQAVRKLTADHPSKQVIAYCHSLYGPPETKPFLEALIDNGSPFTWGRYEREMPDETSARARLDSLYTQEMMGWKNFLFEAQTHIVPVLGCYNVPPESLNENPAVDFKVWLDLQMQHLATHPVFDGLAGVMLYNAKTSDEETLRWLSALYRHYGIEGNSDLLSERYGYRYSLTHLTNPDFHDDLEGWSVHPAEQNSVTTGSFKGLGRLQGRLKGSTRGDHFLRMKRSAKEPNRVAQRIKNLAPGETYSIKMIAMDYGDLVNGISEKKTLALTIHLDDVQLIPGLGMAKIYESSRGQEVGSSFSRNNQPWFSYTWQVFRANSPTALLSITDWTSTGEPGGPIGQEVLFNFVEVQPYYSIH